MTPIVVDKVGRVAKVGDEVVFVSGNYADMQLCLGEIFYVGVDGVIIHPKGSLRKSGMFLIIGDKE